MPGFQLFHYSNHLPIDEQLENHIQGRISFMFSTRQRNLKLKGVN